MIPITISRLSSTCCRFRQRAGRSLLLVPLVSCALACVSCTDQGPPMVDVRPLGGGLNVIAYAVLGVSVK